MEVQKVGIESGRTLELWKDPAILVVWLLSILFSHEYIGNLIIPIDEIIFFEWGGLQTTNQKNTKLNPCGHADKRHAWPRDGILRDGEVDGE